jgi:hypothetical protein
MRECFCRRAPVVQAQPDDAAHVVDGDSRLALVGSQRARSFVGGDVAADAVHVQQRADLADRHLRTVVHSCVSLPRSCPCSCRGMPAAWSPRQHACGLRHKGKH